MTNRQEFWRSGYLDEEGFMRCSCGCGEFRVEEHTERVCVTQSGEPYQVKGRTVYRCASCVRAVIPLRNFDHLPEACPPSVEALIGELGKGEGAS